MIPSSAVELGAIMADLGSTARLCGDTSELDLARPVGGAIVWVPGDPVPCEPGLVIVCTGIRHGMREIRPLLESHDSLVVFLCDTSSFGTEDLAAMATSGHVVAVATVNAGEVVAAVARSTHSAEEAVSRRLASLQRSLSLALAEPTPVPALLTRLKRLGNATTALIDRHGDIVHATGPVPRALLFDQISSSKADTQLLRVDGWNGLAARVPDPATPDRHSGWLVVTSRRADFPSAFDTAAVQVAASLVEASQRMGVVVQQQERAVRAAVLEQALALRSERRDTELAARVAGLGVNFDAEVRVAVASFVRAAPADQRHHAADALQDAMSRLLDLAGQPALLTAREDGVTMLVQTSVPELKRLLAEQGKALPGLFIGIGRPISSVEAVIDSNHDAQLGVRTLQRGTRDRRVMAYEDFDFATRLFADVGLERMVAWAESFLGPVAGRDNLMAGLRAYLENDQNMIAAADALHIHHNSLRYRLAKVEELLGVRLKQPAAVSSVFLALTALDLTRRQRGLKPRAPGPKNDRPFSDAPSVGGVTTFGGPDRGRLGVVPGADREGAVNARGPGGRRSPPRR